MSNLAKILAAGALALSLAGTASAATLTINGGSAGTIPGGTKNGNNALVPLGLAGTAFGPYGGYYGSQIGLTTNTKAKIKFTLLGWEAAYLNTFTSGAGSFGSNGSGGKAGIWSAAGLASFMTTTLPGLLNFSFETDGGPAGPTLTVNNGTNTVPSKNKVNFFASVVGDPTATEGNSMTATPRTTTMTISSSGSMSLQFRFLPRASCCLAPSAAWLPCAVAVKPPDTGLS
jgi:hypothetical protein